MRRLALVLVPLLVPITAALPPDVTYVEWEARATPVGTTRLLMSPLAERFPFEVDACHRRVLVDLLYEPAEIGRDVPGGGEVFLAYDFRIQLWNATSLLADTIVAEPRYGIPLGTVASPGAHELRVSLANGALVNWSLRIRGWEAFDELACEPRVLVNEIEANPPGPDAGKEWVEVVNAADEGADLSLWVVRATHGTPSELTLPSGTWLEPGGRLIVTFTGGQALDNADEVVELVDALGRWRDRTPVRSDAADDARTWQRSPDAGAAWVFATGTPDAPNTG